MDAKEQDKIIKLEPKVESEGNERGRTGNSFILTDKIAILKLADKVTIPSNSTQCMLVVCQLNFSAFSYV